MTTDNQADNALATHMMLDPKIQERVFEVLTEALHKGYVEEQLEYGIAVNTAPVDNFVRALFMNPYFRQKLEDAIRTVALEEQRRYNKIEKVPRRTWFDGI